MVAATYSEALEQTRRLFDAFVLLLVLGEDTNEMKYIENLVADTIKTSDAKSASELGQRLRNGAIEASNSWLKEQNFDGLAVWNILGNEAVWKMAYLNKQDHDYGLVQESV